MLFITSSSESSQICNEIVKFWAAEATKIFQRNSDVSKNLNLVDLFQSFDKKIAENRNDDLLLNM